MLECWPCSLLPVLFPSLLTNFPCDCDDTGPLVGAKTCPADILDRSGMEQGWVSTAGLLPYAGSPGGDAEGPQGGLRALAMSPLELAPRPPPWTLRL